MTYGPDVPAPGSASKFAADEIILYGIKLNAENNFASIDLTQHNDFAPPPASTVLRMQLWRREQANADFAQLERNAVTIAAVYGYAYEGRCSRLEKPRIYVFFYAGQDAAAVGCGFDEQQVNANSYRMWRLKARTPIVEMSVSLDTAETLILEANTPGKRAPNAYESRMELAHRGGRLRDG